MLAGAHSRAVAHTPAAVVRSALPEHGAGKPPLPVRAIRCPSGGMLVDYLQTLYTQAAQPLELEAPPQGDRPYRTPIPYPRLNDRGASQLVSFTEVGSPNTSTDSLPSRQGSLQEAKNPSRLRFEDMYRQLAGWRTAHLSCHVPRNCFDAPPLLGAWVRHMRRLHSAGRLAQWQLDRLNLLGFEWRMDDASSKWINTYHQARRFRAVHGHMDVAAAQLADLEHGARFADLARWLEQQAEALAAGQLTEQQMAMLRLVGASLALPRSSAEEHIKLQGLNAHERKQLRRKLKATSVSPKRLRVRRGPRPSR